MPTLEQVKAMNVGDVFYYGSIPHTVSRMTEWNFVYSRDNRKRACMFPLVQQFADNVRRIIPASEVRTRKQPTYEFIASDGGRTVAGETMDCTVRALALALNMPYKLAHEHMARFGRQTGRGSKNTAEAYRSVEFNGLRLVVAAMRYPANGHGINLTINGWLKSGVLPDRCILQIRGHVFAVVGGKVMDSFRPGPRSHVMAVWEVVRS